jgi:hypothetical protein
VPALAIVRIAPTITSWDEQTGPDPDHEGPGDPPTVVIVRAGTETVIRPVIDIPFDWVGIQLRPASASMLILVEDMAQAAVPNNDNVMPVPLDMTTVVTRPMAVRLRNFFDLTVAQAQWAEGRMVGEVLLALMDVKPTVRNGRRLLRLGRRILRDEAA